jgi:hypothetical protein
MTGTNNMLGYSTSTSLYSGPNVPVDVYQKLPKLDKLSATATSEMFLQWRDKLLDNGKAVAKYDGLMDLEPSESWHQFAIRNRKYSQPELEPFYLDAHKALWTYITGAFDDELRQIMKGIMQTPQRRVENNLSVALKFQDIRSSFYENAYALLKKLEERFVMQSGFRIGKLLTELGKMHYSGKEDPKAFIAKYVAVHNKGVLLTNEFPLYSDYAKAHHILSKLPPFLESLRSQFYTQEENGIPTTLQRVEKSLQHWWVANGEGENRTQKFGRDRQREGHKEKDQSHNDDQQRSESPPPETANALVNGKEGNPNKPSSGRKKPYSKGSSSSADGEDGADDSRSYNFGN